MRWLLLAVAMLGAAAAAEPDASRLERSYWLHASLAPLPQRGYWGPDFPVCVAPTTDQITLAATVLTGDLAAKRLYLVCHAELPVAEAVRVLRDWRVACPTTVDLVPTFVLRMYDPPLTPVYRREELRQLAAFCRDELHSARLAVFDVLPGRDQGDGLAVLSEACPGGLVRVGLQPGESLGEPFVAAVQDTWSGFCHGRRNTEDWQQPGFGAATLRDWVTARNGGLPIVWDLITVAWDYRATERGAYPGYDDAERNDPLPPERNTLGALLIREAAAKGCLAGFSSDLCILQANSYARAHDGPGASFYERLRAGQPYRGTYSAPLAEIATIYRALAAGRWPSPPR